MSDKKELDANKLDKVSGGNSKNFCMNFKLNLGADIKIIGTAKGSYVQSRGFIKGTTDVCYYLKAKDDDDAGYNGWYLESHINISDMMTCATPMSSENIVLVDSYY